MMKLGLLADIHEDVERLRIALDHFQRETVHRIIVLGDIVATREHLVATCQLLAEAGAVGVWGNHDYGLCCELNNGAVESHHPAIIRFMSSLEPRLETGDEYFAHVEPWLDPENIFDLWFFEGMPRSEQRLDRIFGAREQRLLFAGHYHDWLLVRRDGPSEWQGEAPIKLAPPERAFVVVGALCDGHFAIYDTDTHELTPCRASPEPR